MVEDSTRDAPARFAATDTGSQSLAHRRGLVEKIAARARQLGFDLVAVVSAAVPVGIAHYREWLAHHYHGEMVYLARPDAVAKRGDLARILPGVRSVVTAAANYHTVRLPPELPDDPSQGIVASYAWSDDYHDVLKHCLCELGDFIVAETGEPVACRAYVDTGPLLERDLATRAGLGFIGKNTNLIHPRLGSWLLLGELLLTVELPPGGINLGAGEKGTCGQCTRCLDACPTGALVAPYILDARRCISYLTIELKGPIPRELRSLMGNRVFGCDICQEVCPWNRRFARTTSRLDLRPRSDRIALSLLETIALDDEGFRRRFRGSPIRRAKRRGLLRNAAVALGNWGDPGSVPALTSAVGDAEPLIRGHAAWALGRIGTKEAQDALERALAFEIDEWVQQEIQQALSQVTPSRAGASTRARPLPAA